MIFYNYSNIVEKHRIWKRHVMATPRKTNPRVNPQTRLAGGFGEGILLLATPTPTPHTPTHNPWGVSEPVIFPKSR